MYILQQGAWLVSLLALGCATETPGVEEESDESDRILNGYRADIFSFPYQVGLKIGRKITGKYRWIVTTCGGSIIGENFILTAAHCLDKGEAHLDPATADDILVYAKRSWINHVFFGGQRAHVKNIFMHPHANIIPGMKCSDVDSDVAILELTNPLFSRPGIQVIPLAKTNTILPDGVDAQISGYGLEFPDGIPRERLYGADVSIIADEDCDTCLMNATAPDKKICAGTIGEREKSGTLQGDSGGPLVVDGVLEGVASCSGHKECPDLYVRIAHSGIRAFIEQVTGI